MLSSLFAFNGKLVIISLWSVSVQSLGASSAANASVCLVQFGKETLAYLQFSFSLTEWMSKPREEKKNQIKSQCILSSKYWMMYFKQEHFYNKTTSAFLGKGGEREKNPRQ